MALDQLHVTGSWVVLQTEGRFHVPSGTSQCPGEELRLSRIKEHNQREKKKDSPSPVPRRNKYKSKLAISSAQGGELPGQAKGGRVLGTDGEGRVVPPCLLPVSHTARRTSSSSRRVPTTTERALS